MSPVRFQKALRLQEARRLMLSMMVDAGTASSRVGYQSASQFSREYGLFFGSAPIKDIARLREHQSFDPALEGAQPARYPRCRETAVLRSGPGKAFDFAVGRPTSR
jgi:AraC-like DNA-binding protein